MQVGKIFTFPTTVDVETVAEALAETLKPLEARAKVRTATAELNRSAKELLTTVHDGRVFYAQLGGQGVRGELLV